MFLCSRLVRNCDPLVCVVKRKRDLEYGSELEKRDISWMMGTMFFSPFWSGTAIGMCSGEQFISHCGVAVDVVTGCNSRLAEIQS